MKKSILINKAYYGLHDGSKNIDITEYIKCNLFIKKDIKLNNIFGDPYPGIEKILKVDWSIKEIGYKDIKQNYKDSDYIGYKSNYKKCEFKNFYIHEIIKSNFEILQIKIINQDDNVDKIIVDKEKLQKFYGETYFELPNEEPFTGNFQIIRVYYERNAQYNTTIYEYDGSLLKDLVIGIELAMYKLNFIYHLYPLYSHPMMKIHFNYLTKYINLFNNNIFISICCDDNYEAHLSKIKSILNNDKINFLYVKNEKNKGEGNSFNNLISKIKSSNLNEYTFYAHSKGLSKRGNVIENISIWTELMYIYNLSNIDTVIYTNSNFGGIFKINSINFPYPVTSNWHYSGSFYWIKQNILNRSFNYYNHYYISEAFPGLICPENNNCLDYECQFDNPNHNTNIEKYSYIINKCFIDNNIFYKNEFNWKIYINNNEDLRNAGIDNEEKAWNHWIKFGKNELRKYK